ncbi:hypothetical protein ACFE04_030075 [Oxalis oulophora]
MKQSSSTNTTMSLDQWRDYFKSASNSDIFEIIDKAITIAALDCDDDQAFSLRRDRIVERLFTCRLTRCSGCALVESSASDGNGVNMDDHRDGGERDIDGFECPVKSKDSKVNSISKDDNEVRGDDKNNKHIDSSVYSYGEAEALTDELEQETKVVDEVLRIKELLRNSQNESDKVLFDSLRKLQLMALTMDILKATEIGKAVNVLRKHVTSDIRHLARNLINGWKVLVDEWVEATKAVTGAQGDTPDSVNPSVVDEEQGLPSPPLDDLAFISAPPSSMELTQFFDGMDEDGNPQNSGGLVNNRESGRKPSVENQNVLKRKQPADHGVVKPIKPLTNGSLLGKPPKVAVEQKLDLKLQKGPVGGFIQRKLPSSQDNKTKCSDEVAVQRKLEATTRKLQESYQQAENAKRQRTVQVMEIRDIPKQGLVNKNPNGRPFNRQWANGRRQAL